MTTKPINDIQLRTKFVKFIKSDEAREAYINACRKFCGLTEAASSAILWRLTYSPDTAIQDLQRLGLNPEEIFPEILTPLKNELHSQYKQRNPNAWEVDIPEASKEAFNDLKKHVGEIVAAKVFDHCIGRVSIIEDDMERLIFLLKSDMENRYFGGLRELNFSSEQASYLKPFHMLVHNLFVTVYERFNQQSHFNDNFTNKPFEGLSEHLNQKGFTLSDEELPFEMSSPASVETPEQTSTTKFTDLTAENILANKEVFSAFANANDFDSLSQIKNLGFDLNAVIDHIDAISKILQCAELLEEAQNTFDKAAKALCN